MTIAFPPSPNIGDEITDPTTGTIWMWDGTKWTYAEGKPIPKLVPIVFAIPGTFDGNYTIPISLYLKFPANFAGSIGYAANPSTGGASLTVRRIRGGVSTDIGTVNFAATQNNATFTGIEIGLQPSDLIIMSQNTPIDLLLSNGGITLLAERA